MTNAPTLAPTELTQAQRARLFHSDITGFVRAWYVRNEAAWRETPTHG